MNDNERKAFLQALQGLKNFVLADGTIDLKETTAILGLVRPFADADPDCASLVKALELVSADGKVTAEESKSIAILIESLVARGGAAGTGLVYGIEDKPPFFESLFAALQHLLAIFVGIITPLVSGIVVALIGLGLVKVGIIQCCGGFGAMGLPDDNPFAFASWRNLVIAAAVLLTIVLFNSFKNKYIRMGSVVFGLAVGYLVAWQFGMLKFAFSSAAVNVPIPFKWGVQFDIWSILGLAVVYFITSIEANGDITANSMISGLSLTDETYHARVRGGVLADGVNSAVAGCFNSFPNSIFAQNNGLIQLTGVASRHVGYYIAGLLVLLGLFPVVGDLFSTMPDPVLGGATLLMFGMVAAAGIRIIASQPIGRKESLVLAIAFGLGLGVELCPQVMINGNGAPWILKFAPDAVRNIFSSGLVTGGVAAIVANSVIRIKE